MSHSATAPITRHPDEVAARERFAFGKNWKAFLAVVGDPQIASAERSLRTMLGRETLAGLSFLDVGSGSGLFSLAARRLGARVHSFDYDPQSVACTTELKRRHAPDDDGWTIGEGSALDPDYLRSLGRFDVVYSWGVLHHTGAMWRALDFVSELTAPGGQLFIALYNDQGGATRRWLAVKRLYNRLPALARALYVAAIAGWFEARYAAARLLHRRNPLPFAEWQRKRDDRGMSAWHDWVDWIGGLPFETARPEAVVVPLYRRGFVLENLITCAGGHGCNQYVFRNRAQD